MAVYGVQELHYKFEKLADFDVTPFLEQAGVEVENVARTLTPVDTGALRRSIQHQIISSTEVMVATDGSAPYDLFVHQGTGKFADPSTEQYSIKTTDPERIPWTYKDKKGNWHTTYGQKPRKFLTDALDTVKVSGKLEDILKEEVRRQSNA